jgi:hypothetical protein
MRASSHPLDLCGSFCDGVGEHKQVRTCSCDVPDGAVASTYNVCMKKESGRI